MIVPQVVIFVKGGVVQDVLCDQPIKVRLLDFDSDDAAENDQKQVELEGYAQTMESQEIE